MDLQFGASTWLNQSAVSARVKAAIVPRMAKCAALVEAEAKRSLSKGGKRIGAAKLGDKKVPVKHVGSAPGQPPRLRTGNLRASIRYAQTAENTFVVGPATTAWYGRVHEFGAEITVSKKMQGWMGANLGFSLPVGAVMKIPKRPFMGPALARMAAQFPAQFENLPLGGNVGGGV